MPGYILSALSLVAMILVAPWALMLIAMGFDAPGATWGWLHTIVAGLPVSLGVICVTSLHWARCGATKPLFFGFALLVADLAAIAWVWNFA